MINEIIYLIGIAFPHKSLLSHYLSIISAIAIHIVLWCQQSRYQRQAPDIAAIFMPLENSGGRITKVNSLRIRPVSLYLKDIHSIVAGLHNLYPFYYSFIIYPLSLYYHNALPFGSCNREARWELVNQIKCWQITYSTIKPHLLIPILSPVPKIAEKFLLYSSDFILKATICTMKICLLSKRKTIGLLLQVWLFQSLSKFVSEF